MGDSKGWMLGSVVGAVVGRCKFIGAFVDQSRGVEVDVSLVLPSTDGAVDDTKVGSSVLANVLGAMFVCPTGASPIGMPVAGDVGVVESGLVGGPTGELPQDGIAKGLLVGRFQCSSMGEPPVGVETIGVTGAVGVLGSVTGALGDTGESCGNATGFKDIGDRDRGEP
jgi:hypothetical protein